MPARILQPKYGGNFTSDHAGPLPFVLPGELVDLNAILEPSPLRIAPTCDHFGDCGGCQYQHTAQPNQLALKQQILKDIFTEFSLTKLPSIRTHHAQPYGYRNRIRLRVEPEGDTFRAGYSIRASNDFLPIDMCPIAAPILWTAAQALLALSPQLPRLFASVSEVELFTCADESRLQLTLYPRDPEPVRADPMLFPRFCDLLRAHLPQLCGAGATLDPELSRRARRNWDDLAWGAPGLTYEAAGRPYWVSRGAFFQVNRFLVDKLVGLVTADQTGALAWDLFAGVGLFTRALAERFSSVVAVEAGDAAAADLLAASNRGKAYTAVHTPTLDFLREQQLQRERPDLIVLDPPRAGLGPEAAVILPKIKASRLVYVSCDPLTLARDLTVLTRTYRIDSLELIDLFPQTFHIETVVHLSRR